MDRASLPIFFSVPHPVVNGITTYSIYLARGLARLGYPTRILLTEDDTVLATYHERRLELPDDVEVTRLPVSRLDGWGAHWGSLVRLLHENAPCVYVPNSDFRHSVVCPALRPEVMVAGVAHADEPLHYDHVARLGSTWNRIACVSREVADQLSSRFPDFGPRIRSIQNGVEVPAAYPTGRDFEAPLEMVYHGSLRQQQKRILHFPDLLQTIRARGIDARLTLIGSGPDEAELRELGADLIEQGALVVHPPLPNEVLRGKLADYHVYLLNSEFEGMPQALLEAMSQGCVPVVTDVSSGTRDVVEDGVNGFLVQCSDFGAFADRVAKLDADRALLARISREAFDSLERLGLRIQDMARAYDEMIQEMDAERRAGAFVRKPGPIVAPPSAVDGLSVFPIELPAVHPDLGRFPSWGDVDDFVWEAREADSDAGQAAQRHPVFLAVRELTASYGCDLAASLGRGLREQGFDARLLSLQPPTSSAPAPPDGVPLVLSSERRGVAWEDEARRAVRLVAAHPGATYVAFDEESALISARMPRDVRTLLAADEEDASWILDSRIARSLDGLAFSSAQAEAAVFPEGVSEGLRVSVIPHPIHGVGEHAATRSAARAAVYLGHLDGHEPDLRRVRDLVEALDAYGDAAPGLVLGLPARFVPAARRMFARLAGEDRVDVVAAEGRREVHECFREAAWIVLPRAFPDVSLALLDAMGHGCLPVMARNERLEAAFPAELQVGLVEEDTVAAIAERLVQLAGEADDRPALARALRDHVANGYPGTDAVAERWCRLITRAWSDTDRSQRVRASEDDLDLLPEVLIGCRGLGGDYLGELAFDLASELHGEGQSVRFLCRDEPALLPGSLPPGVRIEPVGSGPNLARRVRAAVRRAPPGVFVALDREFAEVVPVLGRGITSVALLHGNELAEARRAPWLSAISGVVLSSIGLESQLFPSGVPDDVTLAVVPFAIHRTDDRGKWRGAGPLRVLTYTGFLDGHDLDADAVRAAVAELRGGSDTGIEVQIAAPGGEERAMIAPVTALARDLGIGVVYTAALHQLRPSFGSTHMLLCPQPLSDISLVMIEALASGCLPVFMPDRKLAGSVPEEFHDGLVRRGGAAAVARRVLSLAGDSEELELITRSHQERVVHSYPGPHEIAGLWSAFLHDVRTAAVLRSLTPEGRRAAAGASLPSLRRWVGGALRRARGWLPGASQLPADR